ncbi:LysE family transporter [Shouchella lonarensis]|uniref:Threonine/homoserine/homoserine lactone efflux protein n=1 Tax=Shouchella lonarensis TaxID=1464122 RepID=A0A1G6IYI2_9BACI|nr:LysE family transporter [Shouchella lonarensis]SDC10836.1 Threonine/homoserine/homoserine lactone efflux protein [Shouchella lonarensis]
MYEAASAMILGVSLAAPVGPICLEVLKRGLSYGFAAAIVVALGGMTADALFMLLISLGLSHFISQMHVQLGLYFIGALFLLYLGSQSIANRHSLSSHQKRASYAPAYLWQSYRVGFGIALFNPINFLFWFGIYGSLFSEMIHRTTSTEFYIHIFFLFVGILLWNVNLAVLAHFGSMWLRGQLLSIVNILAGLMLFYFAAHFIHLLLQLVLSQ